MSLGKFISLCALLATGWEASAQQYPIIPVPGAPKNVKTLFEDSQGRLWLGGDQLACFDGSRLFLMSDYGFPAGPTYSIDGDASGAVWIGAETGVYRFWKGHFERVSKGEAVSVVPAAPDLVIAVLGPLGMSMPAYASVIRITRAGNAWKTENLPGLDVLSPVSLDHTGRLLFMSATGWSELPVNEIAQWHPGAQLSPTRHTLGNPGAGPMRVLRDRFGCVWMGTDAANYYTCDGGDLRGALEEAGAKSNFWESHDGTMVLLGYDLLAIGRPGSFRVAKVANGLPMLLSAIQARDGTVWLGGAQGLYRFASPFQMEYWTARDGVDNPWCVHRVGNKIYAGLNRDIAVLTADRQHWQHLASLEKRGQVMDLLPLPNGNILAALNPGGAALVEQNGTVLARLIPFASPKGDSTYGLHFARTPNGDVWLGGLSLGRLTRSGSRLLFENHFLLTQPAGNVLDVQYEEHTRKLWACYNGGLTVRSEDGSWREINKKDGLLVDAGWSLAALPDGDVWYGYYNYPAFALIRPGREGRLTVQQFRSSDEIRDPESFAFDVDQRGRLWRGGNHGLSVADPAEAEAGRWIYLDDSEGLPGQGVNQASYFADIDGSLWWGIDMNIFHYTPPPDLTSPKFSPQVFVSAFSWNGGAPKLAEALDGLPHGSRVVAHIGSLQFDRRNNLRLRYRVLPDQPAWRETSNLDLNVGKLAWGPHTLEMQGRIFTGPWSGTVSRSFTVLRPVALAWPFLLSYMLIAILSAGGYWLYRRRQAEEAELLPNLAAWRLGALLPEVHELTGTLLDSRFEVGELLARGGFANVMAGYDHEQNQRCAIKVFRSEFKDKGWVQRRFEDEVNALQQVRHPNVVSIYAHGFTPSGSPYLVMEFVEGRSLREALEGGPLPPERSARMLLQLGSALDAIHGQSICHRDVKPENVMIRNEGTRNEQPVLIDFSIAIVKSADETLHGLSRAAGTFDYMAPEQAIGYAQSSSDIYSLAKLAIEMITGRRLSELLPDAALDLPERVRELLKDLNAGFSAESIENLASALEFDPAKRPKVAGVFVADLVSDLESGTQVGNR